MRIAYFGLPLGALLLALDGHDIALAALSQRGTLGTRRLRRRLGERVVAKPDLGSEAFCDRLRASRPELLVSWFWTTRIPRPVRELAPLGAIGVHPSLLPRHRGPDPFFWAIDCGDPITGVTAHQLEDGYDTGAVLGRRELGIDPTWNAWTLARKLDRPSLGLLREVAAAYARGAPPRPEPQIESLATSAPEPDDTMLEIRWQWLTRTIVRRVRAASPYPGAFTQIGERTVTLLRVAEADAFPRTLAPGEAAVLQGGPGRTAVAVVRTGDTAVRLLAARLEDPEGERVLDSGELAHLVALERDGTPVGRV